MKGKMSFSSWPPEHTDNVQDICYTLCPSLISWLPASQLWILWSTMPFSCWPITELFSLPLQALPDKWGVRDCYGGNKKLHLQYKGKGLQQWQGWCMVEWTNWVSCSSETVQGLFLHLSWAIGWGVIFINEGYNQNKSRKHEHFHLLCNPDCEVFPEIKRNLCCPVLQKARHSSLSCGSCPCQCHQKCSCKVQSPYKEKERWGRQKKKRPWHEAGQHSIQTAG